MLQLPINLAFGDPLGLPSWHQLTWCTCANSHVSRCHACAHVHHLLGRYAAALSSSIKPISCMFIRRDRCARWSCRTLFPRFVVSLETNCAERGTTGRVHHYRHVPINRFPWAQGNIPVHQTSLAPLLLCLHHRRCINATC